LLALRVIREKAFCEQLYTKFSPLGEACPALPLYTAKVALLLALPTAYHPHPSKTKGVPRVPSSLIARASTTPTGAKLGHLSAERQPIIPTLLRDSLGVRKSRLILGVIP
jgi:hypothetical protein